MKETAKMSEKLGQEGEGLIQFIIFNSPKVKHNEIELVFTAIEERVF